MRRRLLAAAVLVLLLATCRNWDSPFDPLNNRPPTAPSGPSPDSGRTDVDTNVTLRWRAARDSDPGDRVYYDVHLGLTPSPPKVESAITDTFCHPGGLKPTTLYYWRVIAYDSLGDSAVSRLWRFRTTQANSPPLVPASPSPDSGQQGVWLRPVLTWTGTDPDPGDTVFFDVCFGTHPSPPVVSPRQREARYQPYRLKYDSTYYWRVIAQDNHGAMRVGPVWTFTTCSPLVVTAPDSSSHWVVGSSQSVRWSGGPAGGIANRKTRGTALLPLNSGRRLQSGSRQSALAVAPDTTVIYYSTNNGVSWLRHGVATMPGRYDWRTPGPPSTTAKVQVRAHFGPDTCSGVSAKYETADSSPPSPITVDSPPAGARWVIATQHNTVWRGGTDGVDSTVIFYSSNGGENWQREGRAIQQGRFLWTVPEPATGSAIIRVRAYCASSHTDGLSGLFSVIAPSYPDSVIATVTVGSRPKALAWDSLDNRVFVANYNDSSVTAIDGTTNQVLATIRVGRFPTALLWIPTGNKLFCANYNDSNVTVIDAGSNQVVETVRTGASPTALCWNETGNKVYVANYRSLSVTVIDGATNEVLASVPTDTSPIAICWSRTVNKVYCANWTSSTVTVIDAAADTVVATASVAYAPCALATDGNGNVLVAPRQITQAVRVISGTTNGIIATVGVGQEPWALCFNATANVVYCLNSLDASVSVIDCNSYSVVANRSVGTQPRSAVWAGWVNKAYVGNYDGASVTILDGANHTPVRQLAVGTRPIAFCANRLSNKVYVANYDSGTVSVVGSQ